MRCPVPSGSSAAPDDVSAPATPVGDRPGGGDAMTALKEATKTLHQETEDRPFSAALATGDISLRQYGLHLFGHYVLHADLEDALARSGDVAVRQVAHPGLVKTPLLDADLRVLGLRRATVPKPLLLALEDELRLGQIDGPELLGRLYVFEGSTLGGAILRRRLAQGACPVPAEAMHYYGCYGAELGARWRDFCGRMNAALTRPQDIEAAVAGAADAFRGVGQVFDAVWEVTREEGETSDDAEAAAADASVAA